MLDGGSFPPGSTIKYTDTSMTSGIVSDGIVSDT
jgi:hypothetical protein